MRLVDLKFKPGVDKQDTAYSAGDQRKYVDSDFVDFIMENLRDGVGGSFFLIPM